MLNRTSDEIGGAAFECEVNVIDESADFGDGCNVGAEHFTMLNGLWPLGFASARLAEINTTGVSGRDKIHP